MVELACLFGDEVLAAILRTVAELFPEAYRPLLLSWRAGGRELPGFIPAGVPEAITWSGPVAGLCGWLGDESRAGRLSLVNAWVVAHRLAGTLADADIPGSLIMVSRSDAPTPALLGLDVLTRIPTRVLVCCLLDPVDNPVRAMRDVFSAFYELLARDGQRMALLCLGQRMCGQFQVHVPGLMTAPVSGTLEVPFQLVGQLGAPAASEHGAPDLAPMALH